MKAKVDYEILATAVNNTQDILKEKDVVQHHTQFYLNKGYLHVTDGRMVVGCPVPLKPKDGIFIPGKQFARIVNNLPMTDKPVGLEITDDYTTLIVTASGFRSKLKVQVEGELKHYTPVSYKRKLIQDNSLVDRLSIIRPFISDNATKAWALGAFIRNGKIYATNNVALVETDTAKGWTALLPYWTIDFILSQTHELKGFFVTDKVAGFYWSDKTWMQARLLEGTFPESGIAVIDKVCKGKMSHKITEEWRDIYNRIATLSTEKIRIYADRIYTGDDANHSEEKVKTPYPKGTTETLWMEKFLTKVINVATSWSPRAGAPTPFKGNHVRGAVVGLRLDA